MARRSHRTLNNPSHDLPTARKVVEEYSLFETGPSHPLSQINGYMACACKRCQRWESFLRTGGSHSQPVYLVPTRELILELSKWLCEQQRLLLPSAHVESLRVLEVGAGDGTLCMHLQTSLQAAEGIALHATDSFARGLIPATGASVECLAVDEALAKYSPHIVVCAFMPLGMDWTRQFRSCSSVRAYVLLGETDDGCCGRPWATWGYLCDDDDDAADVCVSSTSSDGDSDTSEDNQVAQKQQKVARETEHAASSKQEKRGPRWEGDTHVAEGSAHVAALPMQSALANMPAPAPVHIAVPLPLPVVPQRVFDESSSKRPWIPSLEHAQAAWRQVYAYEPSITPWGATGWERKELVHLSHELICCTDRCWNRNRHAKAVCFQRT
jgi:hypothetical protein